MCLAGVRGGLVALGIAADCDRMMSAGRRFDDSAALTALRFDDLDAHRYHLLELPSAEHAAPDRTPSRMTMKDTITRKLTEAFAPNLLDIRDESHLHEGHAGHRPGGETHFRVHIVSTAFAGKSRIERHRMVNALLADELAGQVHALAIKADVPA